MTQRRDALQPRLRVQRESVRVERPYIFKNEKFLLKHSTLTEDISIVVILRAMGVESDQEIIGMVGKEQLFQDKMLQSLQAASALGLTTQAMALEVIASKMKLPRRSASAMYDEFDSMWNASKKMRKMRSVLCPTSSSSTCRQYRGRGRTL